MTDTNLLDEINAVHRQVRAAGPDKGEARTIVLRRTYAAEIDEVWHALITPERLARWFLPVTGDLKLGGRYQLEGNAGGEILRCEPPRLLAVSWIFGPGGEDPQSEVEVQLSPTSDGTEFELRHLVPPSPHWDQFGPGAVGVGWDLALPALAIDLAGGDMPSSEEFEASPEAAEFMLHSSKLWAEAHVASGEDAATANSMAEATASFYVPQSL